MRWVSEVVRVAAREGQGTSKRVENETLFRNFVGGGGLRGHTTDSNRTGTGTPSIQ